MRSAIQQNPIYAVGLISSGIIDSMGILELTAFLEQKYGITVADNEMLPNNLDSVDNLIGFIKGKSGK